MRKFIPFLLPACLTIAFSLTVTDSAFSQNDTTTPYVTGITSARARSLVGGVVGLISLIIGWRVRRRNADGTRSRTLAITGLVLGLIALVLSIIHLAATNGDFGTGGGKAGAIVALILGLTGTALNGLALKLKKSER